MKKIAIALTAGLMISGSVMAGNKDRVGSAGATELLINPWSRSVAWAGAGVSSVTGVESMFINVAGLAFTEKTDLSFVRTNWLGNAGISMNTLGLGQRIGETSVLGLSVMNMNFGDLPITTEDLPEGGIGTFTPRYMVIGLSYAKEFSNSIYGGFTVKAINEAIANARASGVAFDAGIRYVTGERDQTKFGITLKNVGPPMAYEGDGFSVLSQLVSTGTSLTLEQRSAKFEMPSQVNIGASYDFQFGEAHKLTLAGSFTSNSFSKDQFRFGAEYGFTAKKATVQLRGGYVLEPQGDDAQRSSALTGPTAGLSAEWLAGEKQSRIGIDYAFQATSVFGGVHSIGIHIDVK